MIPTMKKRITILGLIVLASLTGCVSAARTHFTAGEDEDSKVVRYVISPGLGVIGVDGEEIPPMKQVAFDNRGGGLLNKVFTLNPGKHELKIVFRSDTYEAKNSIPLTVDHQAGQVVFLCYDINRTAFQWKPRTLVASPDQITVEHGIGLGILHIYLTEAKDRNDCYE